MIQIIAGAMGYQTASGMVKNVKRRPLAIPGKASEKVGARR
jgi:hypothetical protein